MLSAQRSVQVAATPQEVLEFVCDLRSYMLLDGKIVKTYGGSPPDADGNGHAVIRGSLRGIPSPKQRLSIRLDRWSSVTFESAGPWLADRFMWFRGVFTAQPSSGGSFVTHSYRFRFKRPVGPLIDRYARDWLEQDLGEEIRRLKAYFDRRAAGLSPLQEPSRRPDPTDRQRSQAKVKAWRDYLPGHWA